MNNLIRRKDGIDDRYRLIHSCWKWLSTLLVGSENYAMLTNNTVNVIIVNQSLKKYRLQRRSPLYIDRPEICLLAFISTLNPICIDNFLLMYFV